MAYREQVEHLAEITYKNTRQIADIVGCSRRSVRRYAGPIWRSRTKEKGGEAVKSPARILLIDIETSLMEVYLWSLWKQNYISPDNVKKSWSVLSWSAKWLFEPRVMSQIVSGKEAKNREDASILPSIWDLLNEANIVIAHNGKKFDTRRLNTRFIAAGMPPPMSYRVIDTLSVTRSNFDMPSYKIDEINKLLGLSTKLEHKFELWKRCAEGDETALSELRHYNENDVLILEETYLTIRPWIKSHPNVGLYIDTTGIVCTNCGHDDLEWDGFYYTPAGKYEAFRCNQCSAIGRSRKSDLTKEERARLIASVAH